MVRVSIGVLLGLLVVVVVLRWMFWSAPGWYGPPTRDDAASIALADRVEHRLAEETHRIRNGEEAWMLRIRDHQVNAWLAIRLPAWLERETGEPWPHKLGMPQVRFREGTIQLTLPIRDGQRMRHLVVDVQPVLNEDDERLTIAITRLAHGRLRLPGSPDEMLNTFIDRHLPEALPKDNEVMAVVLNLLRGRSIDQPRLELQDGRVIEVQRVTLGSDGTLDVRARTIPAGDARTESATTE